MRQEELRGGIIIAFFSVPSRLIEDEPGVGTQLGRHLGQHLVEIGALADQRQPRLGQGLQIGRDQWKHAARGVGVSVPDQPL